MTKDQWQEIYKTLNDIHSEFIQVEYKSKNGKNQKIRDAAEKEMNRLIDKADYRITKDEEVYNLFFGDSNHEYSKQIIYDEFLQSWHFGRDLAKLLDLIKEKIASME